MSQTEHVEPDKQQTGSPAEARNGWASAPPYGNDPFVAKYTASCFCKRVRFEVSGDPMTARLSNCSMSMRLHAAPEQWAALFPKTAVRFAESGLPFLRWYHVESDTLCLAGDERVLPSKVRCDHCGTWVAEEGPDMFMTFPTLFEFVAGDAAVVTGDARPAFPQSFLPECRVFCSSRALHYNDGLPSFLDDRKTPLALSDFLLDIAPRLDGKGHKGQAGRVCVLGGSIDFAGAPYYAGMAALRVGAELLYLCTATEATAPIKSYSPELMVSAVYRHSVLTDPDDAVWMPECDACVEKMVQLFPRLHALVIGPGLGRNERVFEAAARVIEAAREKSVPLILDADSLVLVQQRPSLVKGYSCAVLTPNANEYRLLCKSVMGVDSVPLPELCSALDGPIILQKGATDRICKPGMEAPLTCCDEGAPRRPGGLGDFLAGTLSVLLAWALNRRQDPLQACLAACSLVRHACKAAFAERKRSMVAPDVLDQIGASFEALCPAQVA